MSQKKIGIESWGYDRGAIFTITPSLPAAADWSTFLSKPVGTNGPTEVAGLTLGVEYKGYGRWRVRGHSHPPAGYLPVSSILRRTDMLSTCACAHMLWLLLLRCFRPA